MQTSKQYDACLRWIKALNSGKYKQGKHALRKNNKYCCLGVAAEIENCKSVYGNLFQFTKTYISGTRPPNSWFKRKYGLSIPVSMFVNLNDMDCNLTFKNIAKVIRAAMDY